MEQKSMYQDIVYNLFLVFLLILTLVLRLEARDDRRLARRVSLEDNPREVVLALVNKEG